MLLAAFVAVVLSGCYRTAEFPTPSPAPETRVVALLTPTGEEEMASWIGEDAVRVEGRVVAANGAGLELAIIRVEHREAPSVEWNGQPVTFPPGTLEAVRERSLDRRRTAVVTAAVGAGLFILARAFIWSEITGDSGGVDPDPVF